MIPHLPLLPLQLVDSPNETVIGVDSRRTSYILEPNGDFGTSNSSVEIAQVSEGRGRGRGRGEGEVEGISRSLLLLVARSLGTRVANSKLKFFIESSK